MNRKFIKIFQTTLVIIFLFLFYTHNSYSEDNKSSYEQEYSSAYNYANKGDFVTAIIEMQKITRYSPYYTQAQKKIEEWKKILTTRGISYEKERDKLFFSQAVEFHKRGEIDNAITYFEKIVKNSPNYKEAQAKIQELKSEKQRFVKKEENKETAVKGIEKNPYEAVPENNVIVKSENAYNKLFFEIGFREGIAINTPSGSEFGLKGFSPGIGLSIDYFFVEPLGLHLEGTSFFTGDSVSIFLPLSIRYKFFNTSSFAVFMGIGGFGNYYDSGFSFGSLGEAGLIFKLTNNFSINFALDIGYTFKPESSATLGTRIGGAFSL